ncbi:MAG TPA: DUF4912 domain-containing protein [Anaeromyxobacteraceae bacterium]|nr:DUF4912 domain-containing protein [Anaeromyxobacteraceae bacterium]
MPDFRKMTVQNLRDLARKTLGAEATRLRTKSELIAALEGAGGKEPPSRTPGTRAAQVAGKAIRSVRAAGKAARAGARKAVQAGRAVAEEAAAGARRAAKQAPPGKAGRAAVGGAVRGAAAAAARLRRAAEDEAGGGDPEGYFVARVRGEDAVREAPHLMTEPPPRHTEEPERRKDARRPRPSGFDEGLGDLPWSYGDDAFMALPRDPRTLFLYWDFAQPTLTAAFGGLDHPVSQLWVFARAGDGWDRVRTIDFALEARGYYVHELEPGRTYRAEIHALDRAGRERLVGRASNEVALPPVGPSPVVDDRFVRLPWNVPLGQLLGPGHAGGPFSDEARALLARMSDWSRFGQTTWGGSAGGMGGRPSSPVTAPSSPSSPFGPGGRRDR